METWFVKSLIATVAIVRRSSTCRQSERHERSTSECRNLHILSSVCSSLMLFCTGEPVTIQACVVLSLYTALARGLGASTGYSTNAFCASDTPSNLPVARSRDFGRIGCWRST